MVLGIAIGEEDDADRGVFWGLAGVGAVFTLAGLPISRASYKPASKAVAMYNEHLMQNSIFSKPRAELRLELKPTGAGLVVRF